MQTEKSISDNSKKLNPAFVEGFYKLNDRINEFEKNFAAFENSVQKLKFNGHENVMVDRNWKTDGM